MQICAEIRAEWTPELLCSPGLLLRLYLLDDALHPGHQVSDHREEAELLGRVHQLRPAALAGVQQVLPGSHHLLLRGPDAVGPLSGILGVKPSGRLLELLHLEEQREKSESESGTVGSLS